MQYLFWEFEVLRPIDLKIELVLKGNKRVKPIESLVEKPTLSESSCIRLVLLYGLVPALLHFLATTVEANFDPRVHILELCQSLLRT